VQVWRAHRAQFFSWQQKRAERENGAVEVNPGQAKRLQDHIQALRVQYEVPPPSVSRNCAARCLKHVLVSHEPMCDQIVHRDGRH
jgi:hypothetical protein